FSWAHLILANRDQQKKSPRMAATGTDGRQKNLGPNLGPNPAILRDNRRQAETEGELLRKCRNPEKPAGIASFPGSVKRVGDGTRTHDIQSHSLSPPNRKSCSPKSYVSGRSAHIPQHCPGSRKTPGSNPSEASRIDPDLARVKTAWPGLPKEIRAAILTLISKHMSRMPFAEATQLADSAER